MSLNVAFNGNSLQTFNGSHGIIVQKIHHAGKSNKQAQTYALSHANKSAIPFVEYPNKPITLTGEIVGTSIADYQTQVDTFNSLLTAQNANLDFDYAGGTLNRRYFATCTNIDVTDGELPNNGVFNITFTATQPFGQDTTTTSIISHVDTGASHSYNFTTAGSAPWQSPIITITFSAIGSAPVSGTVNIGNGGTGQQITITRTWSVTPGDVLVIDTSLSTNTPVTVNGVPVDWSGALPIFFTGAGTLEYSDSFSSRTYGMNAVYYKNYL